MVYVTGDCHADWTRFGMKEFPEQKDLTRSDFVVVLGDFGIWNKSKKEDWWLDWFEQKNFTVLFVDGNHECLHKDTEVLTTAGWISIQDVYEDREEYLVASVDLETRKLNFSKALSGVKTFAENLIDFDGANYRQCVTPGHDVIINGKKVKADIAAKMDIAEYDFRLHIDNSFPRVINLEPKMIELLTSVIMDGTIVDYKKYNSRSNKVRIQFHIKKERKIEYIQGLLSHNNIQFSCNRQKDDSVFINIYGDNARMIYTLLNYKKEIPEEWRNLDEEQFKSLEKGLINTDARLLKNTFVWRTTSEHNVDIMSELCIKHNRDIAIKKLEDASGYKVGLSQYHVSIGCNKRIDHKVKIHKVDYNDYAFCLSTVNGTLITRYNKVPCITGNCFDRLYSDEFEIVDFHGGKAHKIRDNVYHLMRGYIFDLCGKKFFAFGGASSHDIQDGILDPADYATKEEFAAVYKDWYESGKMFRVNHVSWWKQELPNHVEMNRGLMNLEAHNMEVDYVITHCLPQCVASMLGFFTPDKLTKYFDSLLDAGLKFKKWHCGHYHINKNIDQYTVLYERIERIL